MLLHAGGTAPRIVDGESKVSAEEGSVASLRCEAVGSPAPTIYWRRGKEEVRLAYFQLLVQLRLILFLFF